VFIDKVDRSFVDETERPETKTVSHRFLHAVICGMSQKVGEIDLKKLVLRSNLFCLSLNMTSQKSHFKQRDSKERQWAHHN